MRLPIPCDYGRSSLYIIPAPSRKYPIMATVLHWWGIVWKIWLLLTAGVHGYLFPLPLSSFDYQHSSYCQHYL
ncbi:MAG: hypothetical protein IJ326_01580 [Lachnospiraceae bacterium]|nr:hypothetical protein [Lachnospiraceae bacterium]